MTLERTNVEFRVADGTTLSAWLYRPADLQGPAPAVTMAHGFGATKEHGIDKVARTFAEAGFVVLLHDHRNFGTSGGTPRHDIDPWRQIEDWRQAITYLESLDDVDPGRIGLWGMSFAGGHAIVLGATDRRLRAVVAQTPSIDGYAAGLRRIAPHDLAAFEATLDDDLRAQLRGAPPRTQQLVDADPNVPAQYHAKDTVDFLLQPVPPGTWRNEITLQSNRRARMYQPGQWVDRVSPTPLLMIVAEHDTTAVTDLALAAYQRALEPKQLVLMPGGHYAGFFDAYKQSSQATIDWFHRYL
jgi:fermentation-respiration switch protein FrsA (DUF1100 family)